MNKILLGLLLVLAMFFASAQERTSVDNIANLIEKLKQQAKETTSIIADFTQEKHMSFMKTSQISEGVLYYQRSGKIRLEQNNPYDYVLLINNSSVRIKDNGKEKNIVGANNMMGKINKLLISIINGDIIDNKEFEVKYFSQGNFYIVELTPNNERLHAIFRSIELSFLKTTTRLKVLTFNEKSGDRSVMKFFNERFNQAIKQTLFLEL